jgi:hypothetical protein
VTVQTPEGRKQQAADFKVDSSISRIGPQLQFALEQVGVVRIHLPQQRLKCVHTSNIRFA